MHSRRTPIRRAQWTMCWSLGTPKAASPLAQGTPEACERCRALRARVNIPHVPPKVRVLGPKTFLLVESMAEEHRLRGIEARRIAEQVADDHVGVVVH